MSREERAWARAAFAVILATSLSCGGGPASTPVTTAPSNLLAVGGSYPTQVSLIADRNSCGAVGVADNLTTVAHTPGAHTLSLTHAANTYSGVVDDAGRFSTTPSTLLLGSSTLTITIGGQFSRTGFVATVEVGVRQASPPPACAYAVSWTGTKQGSPNVIPQG